MEEIKKEAEKLKEYYEGLVKVYKKYDRKLKNLSPNSSNAQSMLLNEMNLIKMKINNFQQTYSGFIKSRKNGLGKFSEKLYINKFQASETFKQKQEVNKSNNQPPNLINKQNIQTHKFINMNEVVERESSLYLRREDNVKVLDAIKSPFDLMVGGLPTHTNIYTQKQDLSNKNMAPFNLKERQSSSYIPLGSQGPMPLYQPERIEVINNSKLNIMNSHKSPNTGKMVMPISSNMSFVPKTVNMQSNYQIGEHSKPIKLNLPYEDVPLRKNSHTNQKLNITKKKKIENEQQIKKSIISENKVKKKKRNEDFLPIEEEICSFLSPMTVFKHENTKPYTDINSNTTSTLRKNLKEIIDDVYDGNINEEIEKKVYKLYDIFIESIAYSSCFFAKNRNDTNINIEDIKIAIKAEYGMEFPDEPLVKNINKIDDEHLKREILVIKENKKKVKKKAK